MGTVVRTSNPRWGRVCGRRQGTAAGAGDAGMQCTGENWGKLGVCWGKRMVTAGHKGLSAAGEPMRGRTTSGMGRSARTAGNLYRLSCPHVEPFPSLQSLYQAFSNGGLQAPSRMGKFMKVQSPSSSYLGTLFSRERLPHLFPPGEAPAAPSRGPGAETACYLEKTDGPWDG